MQDAIGYTPLLFLYYCQPAFQICTLRFLPLKTAYLLQTGPTAQFTLIGARHHTAHTMLNYKWYINNKNSARTVQKTLHQINSTIIMYDNQTSVTTQCSGLVVVWVQCSLPAAPVSTT